MIIGAVLCRLNGDALISVAVGGFPLCNLGSISSEFTASLGGRFPRSLGRSGVGSASSFSGEHGIHYGMLPGGVVMGIVISESASGDPFAGSAMLSRLISTCVSFCKAGEISEADIEKRELDLYLAIESMLHLNDAPPPPLKGAPAAQRVQQQQQQQQQPKLTAALEAVKASDVETIAEGSGETMLAQGQVWAKLFMEQQSGGGGELGESRGGSVTRSKHRRASSRDGFSTLLEAMGEGGAGGAGGEINRAKITPTKDMGGASGGGGMLVPMNEFEAGNVSSMDVPAHGLSDGWAVAARSMKETSVLVGEQDETGGAKQPAMQGQALDVEGRGSVFAGQGSDGAESGEVNLGAHSLPGAFAEDGRVAVRACLREGLYMRDGSRRVVGEVFFTGALPPVDGTAIRISLHPPAGGCEVIMFDQSCVYPDGTVEPGGAKVLTFRVVLRREALAAGEPLIRYSLPDGTGEVPFSLSPSWGGHSLRLEVASASHELSDVSIAACVGVGGVKWRSISPVGYADEAHGRVMWRIGRVGRRGGGRECVLQAEWDAVAEPNDSEKDVGRSIHLQFTGHGRTLSGMRLAQDFGPGENQAKVHALVCPSFEACDVTVSA